MGMSVDFSILFHLEMEFSIECCGMRIIGEHALLLLLTLWVIAKHFRFDSWSVCSFSIYSLIFYGKLNNKWTIFPHFFSWFFSIFFRSENTRYFPIYTYKIVWNKTNCSAEPYWLKGKGNLCVFVVLLCFFCFVSVNICWRSSHSTSI